MKWREDGKTEEEINQNNENNPPICLYIFCWFKVPFIIKTKSLS